MKKLGIIFILLIFISPDKPQNEISELEDIADIAMDNELIPEEWVVTLKEKITQKKAQEYLSTFKEYDIVKYTEYKHVSKYVIRKDDYVENINVTYELSLPRDKEFQPEIVVVIRGTNLSKGTLNEYKNILKHIRNQFFTKNYMLFTCLIASKNGKIASDDFSKKVSEKLDLMYISTQLDIVNGVSYQETVYGYTQKWKNEIFIENKPLNIQIVIQGDNDEKQTVIIGTPLLITEY